MTGISRPDFSEYVAHFTKNAEAIGENAPLIKGDALNRLISILKSKKIRATTMPWTKRKAVAFTPHDFIFEYGDVDFVVLPDYDAMAKFPKEYKDSIGRDKFIFVETYSQIERLWPVHIIWKNAFS